MRVTFLGTGTSTGVPAPTCRCDVCRSEDSRDRRLRPSVLLEWSGASVLIDTPVDLRAQALAHDIARVDAVLYTHAHADHILGMDELRLYNWRRGAAIPVYGSATTLDALCKTFWYVFDGDPPESSKPLIEPIEIDAPFTLLDRRVLPVPVMHGSMPILGYRIGRFAYLTDVSHVPAASRDRLRGLDALVLGALRDRPHPTHMTLAAAVEEAARIGARRTWLTHMSHEVAHESASRRLPPAVELAYDGLVLEVDEETACESG